MTQQAQESSRIPEFASYDEEAEFWDTHDFTNYLDELTPVEVRFAKQLSEGITIRLDSELLAKLYETARTQGTDPALLVRTWVLEHLHETGRSSAPPASSRK